MYKIGFERALGIAIRIYDELVYNSSLSEGNQMTFLQTSQTLSGTVPKGVRTRDVVLVENLKNGLDFIIEKLRDNDFFLEKDTFCFLNRLVANQDNFDNIGGFRKGRIRIKGANHKGTPAEKLEEDFFNTVNRYYDNSKEGERVIEIFLDLCKSQYFGDGNKRTAQFMMCGLLIKEGYAPFSVNFREEELAQALVDFYDDETKRESILKKLIDIQNEITMDFLSDEEIKNFQKKDREIEF